MEYTGDRSLIQMMPIAILRQWANPTPSPANDLELMNDIMQNGIRDPLMLGVGVYSRKIRLETGNHRIYLLPRMGVQELPVVARVSNYCVFNPGNGDHSFNCPYITKKQEWIDEEYWAKPNTVLDIFEIMKAM